MEADVLGAAYGMLDFKGMVRKKCLCFLFDLVAIVLVLTKFHQPCLPYLQCQLSRGREHQR
jgi:hypothetical protein